MASAPSPSSDAALLASYNVNLDDEDGYGVQNGEGVSRSGSPLSLPSSMMDSGDEETPATYASSKKALSADAGGGHSSAVSTKLVRLEQELARVTHEKELLTTDLVRERRKYQDDVNRLRRRNRDEFGQVRTKQAEIEAEIPVLRSRLAQDKESLRNLEISNSLFAELDKLPESQLSIREFVLVQVHRILKKERDAAEVSRREAETLRTELARSKGDAERQCMSLRHRADAAEDREALLLQEVDRMDQARAELSRRLSEASQSASELRSKGASYDSLHQRATALEREIESTKHRADLLQTTVDALSKERDDATSRMLELQQRCEVLTVDKAYLARESESAAARCTRLEETISELRDQKRDLINAKQQFQEELLQEKEKARVGYEDRLSAEITRLQQQSAVELERIHDANAQVQAQQVAALREQVSAAREAASNATSELRELRQIYDELRTSSTRDISEKEAEAAELRSRLKIQTYEVGRTNLTIEEQRLALEEAKTLNEKHEQRFSILREEFLKLEGAAARSKVEYEAMLTAEREKVLGYEALEMELDSAVMVHAAGENGDGASAASASALLPSSSRRRMKNSIALAERLVRSQTENARLKSSLEDGKKELALLQDELTAARDTMSAASGPDAYVVDRLQTQEKKIVELKAHSESVEEQLRRTQSELQRLVRENGELKDELKTVLRNRQQLESIRSAIELLRAQKGLKSPSTKTKEQSVGISSSSAASESSKKDDGHASPDLYRFAPSVSAKASSYGIHINGGIRVREVGESTGHVGSGRARFHSRASPRKQKGKRGLGYVNMMLCVTEI